MKRLLVILVFFTFLFSANITGTKKALSATKTKIAKMNEKLDSLAKEIIKKQKYLKKLEIKEKLINGDIAALSKTLQNSNKTLSQLNDLAKGLNRSKENIKDEIIKFISQNYYLDTQKIESLNDLIHSEINKQVINAYSKEVQNLVEKYKTIDSNLRKTDSKIKEILNRKKSLEHKKQQLSNLKKQKLKELKALKKEKENYKKKLLAMIKKQENLRKKLQELKIVKKEKPLNVKKVGSAYLKPKTASYRGKKTIPPVYGRVVKKFGSYIDPIYKIRIYNDSITIKTKPNSTVRSIMRGKVVYIGENNGKKLIFIKHPGNLFSIYANLSKISPLLKKGSYVKKGQIIARVENSLEFEVTYKDKPINPLKVINLR